MQLEHGKTTIDDKTQMAVSPLSQMQFGVSKKKIKKYLSCFAVIQKKIFFFLASFTICGETFVKTKKYWFRLPEKIKSNFLRSLI